ncbi:MAG: sodium:solute symporter family protein [Clostridia bacterium]|nr:sodium:solute symporter family protein [Clostridia bacterium]
MVNLGQVQTVTIIALVLFSAMMIGIGLYTSQRAKNIYGFLLGSRSIGPWMSAFAYGTSYFSAVIFVGYAGNHGWNIGIGSIWIGIGNAVLGCLLAWLVLAKRTRSLTHKLGAKTMPEFFEARYSSQAMKIYAAVIIFVFLVPYSAAVYKGLGSMFNVIFPDVPVWVIMLFIAVLSAIYLVLGGYVATSHTDFVQGIVMIAGIVMMVGILLNHQSVGGLGGAIEKIRILGEDDGVSSLTDIFGGNKWSFLASNILLTSFGTWGLPQMVGKYYAIKDEKSIRYATVIATLFSLIIGIGAYFVGFLGRIFLNNTLPEGGVDYVVPNTLMAALGDTNLFTTAVLALILLLLLSASMSTLSSVVLTSASSISVDLLPVIKPDYDKRKQMILTRALCLLFVGFSFLFAVMKISVIVNIMSFSWGVVSGCFIGPFIWGIYSKKISRAGAWCGLLSGFLVVLGLTVYKTITNDFSAALNFAPISGVAAMAVSFIIVPLVSAFTAPVENNSISTERDAVM